MAYCSTSAILSLLPGLPQTTATSGYTATAALIAKSISRADSLIDSSCARRYSVPFGTTPPLIGSISEDLTCYFTYRSLYTQDNSNRTEYFEELRDNCLKWLDEIVERKRDLVDSSGNVISEKTVANTTFIDSSHYDYQPFFDIDEPTDWKFADDLKSSVDGNR